MAEGRHIWECGTQMGFSPAPIHHDGVHDHHCSFILLGHSCYDCQATGPMADTNVLSVDSLLKAFDHNEPSLRSLKSRTLVQPPGMWLNHRSRSQS